MTLHCRRAARTAELPEGSDRRCQRGQAAALALGSVRQGGVVDRVLADDRLNAASDGWGQTRRQSAVWPRRDVGTKTRSR
jgi:hypothetical protein